MRDLHDHAPLVQTSSMRFARSVVVSLSRTKACPRVRNRSSPGGLRSPETDSIFSSMSSLDRDSS